MLQNPTKTLALIFSSRKVWIALAAVAGCVVIVCGADPAKWTPLIASIVTLSSVVVAAISYEDGAGKRNPFGDAGGNPALNIPAAPDASPQGQIVHSYRESAAPANVSPAQAKAAATNLLLIGLSLAALAALALTGCGAVQPAVAPTTQPTALPAPAPANPTAPTVAQLTTQLQNLQLLVNDAAAVLAVVQPLIPPQYYASALAAEQLAADAISLAETALGNGSLSSIVALIQNAETAVAAFTTHPAVVAAKASVKMVPATKPAN